MCQDLPSCEFLPTKNRRAPIVADKAEQSRYFYESTELSTLQERTGIKVNRSKVSAALSLCLLATLGATQAVLAQGGAHIADNSGAESSHVIFVPLPPEVSRAEVQHADAVLKDKLYHHVQNWLSSQEPTPGVNNQTDLVIILTDQDGTPILPDVEAARSRFNLAEAPSVQATANELTFTFNSSDYPWTATEIADLQTQLGDYYPTAKAFYGNPAFSIAVNVRKDPTISYSGEYNPTLNEMDVKSNTDHDVICHEMIHAFHDDDIISLNSYEEGMTRAAEVEVFDRLSAYTHPDENHSYTYDVYYEALSRPEIGSRNGNFFQTNPNTFAFLRYQLSGYAWWKVFLETQQFFLRFNQQLYSAIISDPSTQYTESKLVDIATLAQPTVEGQSFRNWYAQQSVLNTLPAPGYFLYQRINQFDAAYFYRDPVSGAETMQGNATINWAVYDYQDVLLDGGSGVTGAYGFIDFLPNIPAAYTGRIKIVTNATSPEGPVSNTAFRPAQNETGVFGVVLGANSGAVTVTPLNPSSAPITVNITNGSFSIPSLASIRGRFRAVFTAANGQSVSKQFNKDASDYFLQLVPVRFECENLTVQALSGATHSIITDAKLSGGAGTQLSATGTGQYVTYAVPVFAAGTYKVKVRVKTGPTRGVFRLSIGGVNQGQTQNEYSAAIGYAVRDLGTVTFFTSGSTPFKFLVTGKNANSGGYDLAFDYIELIPTNRLETEALKVQSITPVPSSYTSAQWFGAFSASAASGGAGTYFNAIAPANYITYSVPVATAGTYHVRVGVQSKPNKGTFQLAINGANKGLPQDEYAPAVDYGVRDLGTISLNSGNQAFKFTVTGRDANSTGYTLAFDYIELVP